MPVNLRFLRLVFCILSISLFFYITSCEKSDKPFEPQPPIPPKDTITISIESLSHRSISIHIHKELKRQSDTYLLNRYLEDNKVIVFNHGISVDDTIVVDDNQGKGLELNTTYGYQVFRIDSLNVRQDSSNTVNATTLAATSHDYTWERITIGEWQSFLTDVWGTDENNVYAVGKVIIDGEPYGILKWDGSEWKPELFRGGRLAIFGFTEDDIWEAGNNHVAHFDGNEWKRIDGYTVDNQSFPLDQVLFDNSPYTSIWGTSSENLYFTGLDGKIIYWNGEQGSLMTTPTEVALVDIYGLSSDYILAAGTDLLSTTALIYDGISWNYIDGLNFDTNLFTTIFPVSRTEYYVGGSKSFRRFGDEWEEVIGDTLGIINKIRGNHNTGEIVAVGDANTLLHFNGESWHTVSFDIRTDTFNSIYISDTAIFVVGTTQGAAQALILIGKRVEF